LIFVLKLSFRPFSHPFMIRNHSSLSYTAARSPHGQNVDLSRSILPTVSTSTAATGTRRDAIQEETIYDFTFWLAYLSNALVSAGNTLLCRYADYVNFLGADEFHLGWIIGFGMVGSLVMRFALGHSIDRFGARRIWLLTILATTLGCLIHLGIGDYRGPSIYLARVFYIISLAGVFSSSMTLISSRAPKQRLAEVVGIYGSAGFAGVLLGAPLADLLFPSGITSIWESKLLFLVAGGICLLSFPLAWAVPPEKGSRRPKGQAVEGGLRKTPWASSREPSMFQVLIRYTSIPFLVAGTVAGAALSVPPTFLPRYVAEFGVHSVSGFFFLYAATAVAIRAFLLRYASVLRLDRMIMFGTCILCASQLLFLTVRSPWQLVFPGLVFGVAQALLFPAIVAAGSSTFPKRHRGLATTLMMATFDAGLLLGGPLAGITLRLARDFGWPRYPTMFLVMAGTLVLFAIYFAGTMKATKASPMHRRKRPRGPQTIAVAPVTAQQGSFTEAHTLTAANAGSYEDEVLSEPSSEKPVTVTAEQRLAQPSISGLEIPGTPVRNLSLPKAEPVTSPA